MATQVQPELDAPFQKWDRLEIHWEDSYRTHGWLPLEEAMTEEDYCLDHRTIGYFVGETDRQISVCQSSKTDERLISEPDTQVDAVMHIPKAAITLIVRLGEAHVPTVKR